MMLNPKNILVMKLGGIGDVITMLPAAKALRDSFPKSHITLLAEDISVEAVKDSNYFDDYIIFTDLYRCQNYMKFLTPHLIKREIEFVKRLRCRKYDLYIEFHSLYHPSSIVKPMLVGYLSGAGERVGLDTFGRGFFLTRKVYDDRFEFKHMIDRFLDIVQAVGAEAKTKKVKIQLTDSDRTFAEKVFSSNNISPEELVICMHPGANPDFPIKYWPAENFIEVGRKLTSKYNARIIIVAGRRETELAESVQKGIGDRAVNIAGCTSVKELAAVIEKSDIFVGADSGPMHIAANLGVQTVAIFGPGDYQAYGTYPKEFGNFTALWKRQNCWPCIKIKRCTDNKCMKAVTASEVVTECEKKIKALDKK